MTIEESIIQKLLGGANVELSGIGVLSFRIEHAQFSEEDQTFMPPTRRLRFKLNRSLQVSNEFSDFSKQALVQLLREEDVSIKGLGRLTNKAGKIDFIQEEEMSEQDFYGFESLQLSSAGILTDDDEASTKKHSFWNRFLLWFFLIIIPLAAIVYFGYTRQDQILKFLNSNSSSSMKKTPANVKPVIKKEEK